MIIEPGQEALLVAIDPVSIHGDAYFDVVIADPARPDDADRQLRGRLGREAVEGDPAPGDRVRVEGFLQTITRIVRI